MTDADESLRQDVKQEAPNELVGGDHHRSRLVAASVIPPAKRNVVAIESDEPVVGDGDTVGIAAEVADDLLGPAEGGLCINNPILTKQCSEEGSKAFRFGQMLDRSGTSQQVLLKSTVGS